MLGTIKRHTQIKEFPADSGKFNIGILFEGFDDWFNYYDDKEILEASMEFVKAGNILEFEKDDRNSMSNVKLIGHETKKQETSTQPTTQPKNNMISIKGKDYMVYAGLLDKAHAKDEKFSMAIIDKYVSEDMKMAWCIVRLKSGDQVFDGFGSSTPDNTGAMTSDHPVEMAHTRAKGRALRDFINYGEAMAEELKQ